MKNKIGLWFLLGLSGIGAVFFCFLAGMESSNDFFNSLVVDNMPGWFYRFIMRHGNPAGVCLIMIVSAAINALSANFLFTKAMKL